MTSLKWVVDSTNGEEFPGLSCKLDSSSLILFFVARFKRWQSVKGIIQNTIIPSLPDLIRIICGLVNCYQTPASRNLSNDIYGDIMLEKLNDTNKVKERVINNNLLHHSKWKKKNAEYYSFPGITEQELLNITRGEFN